MQDYVRVETAGPSTVTDTENRLDTYSEQRCNELSQEGKNAHRRFHTPFSWDSHRGSSSVQGRDACVTSGRPGLSDEPRSLSPRNSVQAHVLNIEVVSPDPHHVIPADRAHGQPRRHHDGSSPTSSG